MKKTSLLLFFGLILTSFSLQAQRYLTPQFTSVTITPKIKYADNYTWLATFSTGHTGKQPLTLDLYTPPPTDTVAKRPLALYLHGGNFLPPSLSGSSSYSTMDSSDVEICTRLAKLGYVAAAVDYRIGWNPASDKFDVREGTIINASYRGVQDIRTAIRYFKANAGIYGVDTTKIVVWGESTGAYIALASAVLDSFKKVYNTKYPVGKFFFSAALGGGPMAFDSLNGNWVNGDPDGKHFGVAVPQTLLSATGDTLSLANYPANSSDYQMTVNLGGAIGDLSWIDKKTKPILSFQAPYDLFAPYDDQTLLVPTATGAQPVIRVQGAHLVQRAMDSLGNNNIFGLVKASADPYGAIFKSRSEGYKGLFPILGDTITDSSPWFFWGATTPNAAASQATCPRCTPARARLYIDTIMGVYAPRACLALGLSCASLVAATGTTSVTFRVNIDTLKVGATDSILIGGDFTNPQWTPTAFKLTRVGCTNVFQTTLKVPNVNSISGSSIQFKFVRNNWGGTAGCASCKDESISGTCGGAGINNRVAQIPYSADSTKPFVLPIFKFNSCDTTPPTSVAGSRQVTFTVDMDTVVVGATDSVLIGGDFTNPQWTPTKFRLTRVGTTNLYRTTLRVAPVDPIKGDTIQYKFVRDNWGGTAGCANCKDESISGTCGGAGINNRVAIIPCSTDSVTPYKLPTYKFGTCTLSTVATQEILSQNLIKIAPNPAYTFVRFETEGAEQIKSIDLYDLSGRLVQRNAKVDNFTFDLQRNGLPSGVYIAKITFPAGVLAKKVLFE